MADHLGRIEKDFAVEFGEYLARAADRVLPHLEDVESARALRSAIYEFRKRAIKAATPVHDHLFQR